MNNCYKTIIYSNNTFKMIMANYETWNKTKPANDNKIKSYNERRAREIASWLGERERRGEKLYLLTFQFHQTPKWLQRQVMRDAIEKTYSFSAGKIDPNKPAQKDIKKLPLMIFCKDFPVHNRKNRGNLSDLIINDGLHYHAIIAFPNTQSGLDFPSLFAFKIEKRLLRTTDYLKLVHIKPIIETPLKVVKYCLKEGNRLNPDEEPDWDVLPKTNDQKWLAVEK